MSVGPRGQGVASSGDGTGDGLGRHTVDRAGIDRAGIEHGTIDPAVVALAAAGQAAIGRADIGQAAIVHSAIDHSSRDRAAINRAAIGQAAINRAAIGQAAINRGAIDHAAIDRAAIDRAADLLAAGQLVAFPTETVYGLGARADDDAAVGQVFALKGRPADHPLIVHVADAADAHRFAAVWPEVARRLVDAFWPGPLTVIVPRAAGIAAAAAGGQSSIGLRCPSHPVARALLMAARERGVPGVAAPSANRFGRISPTRAAHVVGEFAAGLVVLDGGDCAVGIESTIVDCSRAAPVLLRPGVLTRAALEAAAGTGLEDRDAGAPRASGTLAAHYAPRAPLRLWALPELHSALQSAGSTASGLAVYSRTAPPEGAAGPQWRRMPDDAAAAAHELFAVLRELDAAGARAIWVESPPPGAAWDGVRDRLQRAAAAAPPAP